MWWADASVWFAGTAVSIISFLVGKSYKQSEQVIAEKRRVYESFLRVCPAPNEAHLDLDIFDTELQRYIGVLTVYASPEVTKFAGEYFAEFAEAQAVLCGVEKPGHPAFLKLMTHYNRMVWAMRNDALMWSFFAPTGKAKEYRPSIGPDKAQ